MYVTDEMIARMAALYGKPRRVGFVFDVTERELQRIRRSQKKGRNHDVTVYIRKDERLIVIAKHSYPPGLYRVPSGGLRPRESFVEGIKREMTEEAGCEIGLDRFLLRTAVTFTCGNDSIAWRSFVFTADFVRGDFEFTDRREIREVRLAEWHEFEAFGRIMRRTDIGGFHYRAALHDAVEKLIR